MINRPKMARRVLPTAIALGLLVPAGFAPLALAQQADEMVEEIVTICSRRPTAQQYRFISSCRRDQW